MQNYTLHECGFTDADAQRVLQRCARVHTEDIFVDSYMFIFAIWLHLYVFESFRLPKKEIGEITLM